MNVDLRQFDLSEFFAKNPEIATEDRAVIQEHHNNIVKLSMQMDLAKKAKRIVRKLDSRKLSAEAEATALQELVDLGVERILLVSL